MKKFVCPVCGYVHEGDSAPEKCPQCGVPGTKFNEMAEGGLNYACEHVIGVGAMDKIEKDVYEGLKANFEGECVLHLFERTLRLVLKKWQKSLAKT